jgi:catechol 2,3-dioxygenase-like lactoylglutathione lyase family enzyme
MATTTNIRSQEMPADGAQLTFSLDHVGIDVDDLPAQIDFYSRAFDLKVELQGDVPEYNFRAAMLVSPTGWHLELFKRDGAAPRPVPDDVDGQHNVLGLGHVCLAVDDLEAGLDLLLSLGAAMRLPPIPYPGIPEWRLAYLADPEGNLVELVSRS